MSRSKRAQRVRKSSRAILYADIRERLRAVSRSRPDYAEVKAHTLDALLRTQPGYAQASVGKNKRRVRWVLDTIPALPHHLVLNYLPAGCIGAAKLIRASLNRHCTYVPHITIEQLCVLVLELAPAVVFQAQMDAA
jgi:hypothetical protein